MTDIVVNATSHSKREGKGSANEKDQHCVTLREEGRTRARLSRVGQTSPPTPFRTLLSFSLPSPLSFLRAALPRPPSSFSLSPSGTALYSLLSFSSRFSSANQICMPRALIGGAPRGVSPPLPVLVLRRPPAILSPLAPRPRPATAGPCRAGRPVSVAAGRITQRGVIWKHFRKVRSGQKQVHGKVNGCHDKEENTRIMWFAGAGGKSSTGDGQ